jgi:hypothetical protein
MKSLASRVVGIPLAFVIVALAVKSCVVTVWKPPSEATTYAVRGADGRALTMTFLPNGETLFIYANRNSNALELSLTKMRGVYGTNYFGRVWRLDGPGLGAGWLGLRLYPDGAKPVVMETTVLKKSVHGTAKQALPSEGETTHPVILFSDDQIEFGSMTLDREPTDSKALAIALSTLRPNK